MLILCGEGPPLEFPQQGTMLVMAAVVSCLSRQGHRERRQTS